MATNDLQGSTRAKRVHHDLLAWQNAMILAKMVYAVTATFPVEEKYGLVSQMRSAAVSVPSNIAEGASRVGVREFRNFLSFARGSLSELETQAQLAQDLGYGNLTTVLDMIDREFALLNGLMKFLRKGSDE